MVTVMDCRSTQDTVVSGLDEYPSYYFPLYAHNAPLTAHSGLNRQELLSQIHNHIIKQNRLVGTYLR